MNDFEPLSPHVRYAISRNAIIWKGEHQQKLKAINHDYQLKADAIWHNRTQAARDYVIDVMNASQMQQASGTKPPSRNSNARDRQAMAKIQALSETYLSQAMLQRVDAKRLRQSLMETSLKEQQQNQLQHQQTGSCFLTQSNDQESGEGVLPQIRRGRNPSADSGDKWRTNRADPETFYRLSRDDVHLQQVRHVQSARGRSRGSIGDVNNSSVIGDVSAEIRPSTTSATLPIRRTSCRLSTTAKSLLELRKMQQRQRLAAPKRNNSFPGAGGDFSELAISTRLGGEEARSAAPPRSFYTTPKPRQVEQVPQNVDVKIKGFCERLLASSDSPQWRKYNSKWTVLQEYVRTGSVRLHTPEVVPSKATPIRSETCMKLPREPSGRKLSVRWSDPLEV